MSRKRSESTRAGGIRALPVNLTANERRVFERRQKQLHDFEVLRRFGVTRDAAAKAVGSSIPSLWRWQKRAAPRYSSCGRKSAYRRFNPPQCLLAKVQKLQLAGISNSDAWRTVARDRDCPAALAWFLRRVPTIPTCFLAQTRLAKRSVPVSEGRDFVYLGKSEPRTR